MLSLDLESTTFLKKSRFILLSPSSTDQKNKTALLLIEVVYIYIYMYVYIAIFSFEPNNNNQQQLCYKHKVENTTDGVAQVLRHGQLEASGRGGESYL